MRGLRQRDGEGDDRRFVAPIGNQIVDHQPAERSDVVEDPPVLGSGAGGPAGGSTSLARSGGRHRPSHAAGMGRAPIDGSQHRDALDHTQVAGQLLGALRAPARDQEARPQALGEGSGFAL